MTNTAVLAPAMVLQGDLRVLLMKAGLDANASLDVACNAIDLVMQSEVVPPALKAAYADLSDGPIDTTVSTPALQLQGDLRSLLARSGLGAGAATDTSLQMVDMVMRSGAVRPAIRETYARLML